MDRRKPTVLEQVQLARNVVANFAQDMSMSTGDRLSEVYAVAYRSMGGVEWLDDESRAGIARVAASCWRIGVRPYSEFGPDDFEAAEAIERRQWQRRV